jgi:hypothetical protein
VFESPNASLLHLAMFAGYHSANVVTPQNSPVSGVTEPGRSHIEDKGINNTEADRILAVIAAHSAFSHPTTAMQCGDLETWRDDAHLRRRNSRIRSRMTRETVIPALCFASNALATIYLPTRHCRSIVLLSPPSFLDESRTEAPWHRKRKSNLRWLQLTQHLCS